MPEGDEKSGSTSPTMAEQEKAECAESDQLVPSLPIDIPASGSRARAATYDTGDGCVFGVECSGLPPKEPHFDSFKAEFEDRSRKASARRSTLGDHPELDHRLQESMTSYEGTNHLPMTSDVLHHLSPLWKGRKPIANFKLFERILINRDVNKVHADHVVAALERVGMHCKHLVIVAPIHTAELGEVFKRDLSTMDASSSDWDQIFKCFPNLESVTYNHPDGEPVDLMVHTFKSFQHAVEKAGVKSLDVRVLAPADLFKRCA